MFFEFCPCFPLHIYCFCIILWLIMLSMGHTPGIKLEEYKFLHFLKKLASPVLIEVNLNYDNRAYEFLVRKNCYICPQLEKLYSQIGYRELGSCNLYPRIVLQNLQLLIEFLGQPRLIYFLARIYQST